MKGVKLLFSGMTGGQLMWQEPKCFLERGLKASRKSLFRIIGLTVCSAIGPGTAGSERGDKVGDAERAAPRRGKWSSLKQDILTLQRIGHFYFATTQRPSPPCFFEINNVISTQQAIVCKITDLMLSKVD